MGGNLELAKALNVRHTGGSPLNWETVAVDRASVGFSDFGISLWDVR